MANLTLVVRKEEICRVYCRYSWGFCSWWATGSVALAASQKAAALRQANGLTAFTPTEKFLAGNFVADEMNPAFIFGTVQGLCRLSQVSHHLAHRGGRQNSPGRAGQPGPAHGVYPLPGGGLPG